MRVLLAGASGQVGRRVEASLSSVGLEVQAIRGIDLTVPGAANGMAEGCEVVVSCAGASVAMAAKDRRGYGQVDPVLNRNLLVEARRAGSGRFVYLAAHTEPSYSGTAYIRAHEQFVEDLRSSGLSYTVVRPTGIFSAFADLLPMARRGIVPLIGDGLARTNPIDPQDVADLILEYLHEGPTDVPCGGPEVLTRAEINQALARACGKPDPWMPKMPASVVRLEAKAVRLFHPRMADLMEFFAAVATSDCIAPALGKRRLEDYRF